MKKQLILWLTAITLILSACVDDKYAESSRTPMQFTVSIDDNRATTRSNTVNDTWTNGDPVAIQITSGTSTVVKKYKIDNSASPIKLVPDVGVEPFYWPHSGSTSVTVSAWYPYSATRPEASTSNTAITDQSTAEKYEAANLMEAADVTRAYNATLPTTPETPLELTFSHRMAKLIIRPFHDKDTEGHDTSQLIAAEVAKTTTKAINLCSDEITVYRKDRQFEVLVAPQTIPAATKFIKLSYRNDNTKSSTFEFSETTSKTLEAGKTYIFNVKLNTAADSAFVVTLNTVETPTYDGTQKNYPGINSVKCNGKTLTVNVDYVIDEANSTLSVTNAGTYDVTIKGTGQYRGTNTRTVQWTINKAHETGSISYAPTPINKTVGAEPFTNTLSNNINHGNVRYTSSNEYVATVDSNGLVTIHHAGSCTITATVEDANYTFDSNTASYDLTVSAAPTTL